LKFFIRKLLIYEAVFSNKKVVFPFLAKTKKNMLAMNYRGPQRVRIDHKPMPEILHPEDAIVRVTRSCICGSDLHLYNGNVPDTRVGMTFGHEFVGVVEEIGLGVQKLKVGDNVLVPFNIACGKCAFCKQGFLPVAMKQILKPLP
jgi:threonine dehydrogenase-like Zn-dependent dehydrogenase